MSGWVPSQYGSDGDPGSVPETSNLGALAYTEEGWAWTSCGINFALVHVAVGTCISFQVSMLSTGVRHPRREWRCRIKRAHTGMMCGTRKLKIAIRRSNEFRSNLKILNEGDP